MTRSPAIADRLERLLTDLFEIDPGDVAAACARNGIEVLGPPPGPLD